MTDNENTGSEGAPPTLRGWKGPLCSVQLRRQEKRSPSIREMSEDWSVFPSQPGPEGDWRMTTWQHLSTNSIVKIDHEGDHGSRTVAGRMGDTWDGSTPRARQWQVDEAGSGQPRQAVLAGGKRSQAHVETGL